MALNLIYARDSVGVIGLSGPHKMLFSAEGDLPRFKKLTWGTAMIMGKDTFLSLPGMLPGRLHIVLSSDPDWWPPKSKKVNHLFTTATSIADAVRIAKRKGFDNQFIIGGVRPIEMAIPFAYTIHETVLKKLAPRVDGELARVSGSSLMLIQDMYHREYTISHSDHVYNIWKMPSNQARNLSRVVALGGK